MAIVNVVRRLASMLIIVILVPAGLRTLAMSTSLFTVRMSRLQLGRLPFRLSLNLSTE